MKHVAGKFSHILAYTAIFATLFSCLPESGRHRTGTTTDDSTDEPPLPSEPVDILEPEIRLLHIIDPYDGNYKSKVTISKNFSSVLMIAGLNLDQLKKESEIWVRMRFGKDLSPIELPALIASTPLPGLTSTATIDVIQVDLNRAPLASIKLLYHLYDYNQYETEDEPVTDPFHGRLFCRALSLTHDPTFQQSSTTSTCSRPGAQCLYSYAQVYDQGPYNNGVGIIPTEKQFALNSSGIYGDDNMQQLSRKCLADNADDTFTWGSTFTIPSSGVTGPIIPNTSTGTNTSYEYRGPYRPSQTRDWQITGGAVAKADNEGSFWGLFERWQFPLDPATGFYSLKFPRAGRVKIRQNVEYIGLDTSPTVTSHLTRSLSSITPGEDMTQLMDGCNLRVHHWNRDTNEGIESCTVTALLEVGTKDPDTDQFLIVHNASDPRLKIQLVRKTSKSSLNPDDLIHFNFPTCSSNNDCGSDECCYNRRCWSNSIVSQCSYTPSSEQLSIGQRCSNDLSCESICCAADTGRCSSHDGQQSLCSKPVGTSCIADDFCAQITQTQYRKIKTGIAPKTGRITCAYRPFNVRVFARCIRSLGSSQGFCQAPPHQPPPTFDPANVDCSDAQDPPTQ